MIYSIRLYIIKDTRKVVDGGADLIWNEEQTFNFVKKMICLIKYKARIVAQNQDIAKSKRLYVESIIEEIGEYNLFVF